MFEGMKRRMEARKAAKEAVDEKLEKGFDKVDLEKGDLFAILLAGFINFVLPIMLIIGAICGIAYFFFTRFR